MSWFGGNGGRWGDRDNRIEELKREKAELERENAKFRSMQELLDARTAELTEAQTFLSMVDNLSERDVLSIVESLNEHILQLAASLTDAWEQLEPSQATGPIEDPTSQPYHSILVQLARERNSTGLIYLLQSRLCYQAVIMTSSWVRNKEPGELGSVYQHLSASGEHFIINTKLYATYVS